MKNEKFQKVINILKKIAIIITSPIWFPWKVLFIRKPEKKFNKVSNPIKVFRIVRSPITIPLKFICFMCIISLEVLVVYKARYSVVTYPVTRASVYNYYVKNTTNTKKLLGITTVNACEIKNHNNEFKLAFSYIDDWDLSSKNKMYVTLDSKALKYVFNHIDDDTVSYLLNKFNTNADFRDDIHNIAKNINKLLQRLIKEIPEEVPYDEIQPIMAPFATISSYSVDYRQVLDILGTLINWVESNYGSVEENLDLSPENLDMVIELIVMYSEGNSITDSYNYINEKYFDTIYHEEVTYSTNEIKVQ